MWHSDQTPDRVRTNQNMRVYFVIRPRGVLDRDLDEREVMYKDRAVNA